MELISFVASSFTVGFAYFSLQQWIPALVAVVSTTNAANRNQVTSTHDEEGQAD